MGKVPGCVHEGLVVGGHGVGIEDIGVTMLLIVKAMKFRALIIWVSQGSSSTGGTMIMGIVWAEVFHGLASIAPT